MLAPELPQRQEAKPPGKTSELYIPRQEPKPPGKTSEFQYPEDRRQNHQERHQSYPKAGVKNTRRDIRVTPIQKRPTSKAARRTQASKHQNHHQRSCCRKPGRRQKKDEEHKHQVVKIITKGLVVALQPGRRQKQDQEHKHQIIKIVSCCFMPY